MAIAKRLERYLEDHGLGYERVHHARSATSLESARAAHVPAGKLAKCVLLHDDRGYLLAVLPASCHLELSEVVRQTQRRLALATEAELGRVFRDCELGAVPAAGHAYGIPTLVDESLLRMPDVYVESGDHEELLHVSGPAFRELVAASLHGRFSRPD